LYGTALTANYYEKDERQQQDERHSGQTDVDNGHRHAASPPSITTQPIICNTPVYKLSAVASIV